MPRKIRRVRKKTRGLNNKTKTKITLFFKKINPFGKKNPQNRANRVGSSKRKFIFWLKRLIGLSFILGLFVLGAFFVWVSTLTIPSVDTIHKLQVAQSTKIFDKDGELLYNVHGDETRTVVPIEKMSKYLQDAAVAIEDKDFYNHKGVKLTSFAMSAYENIIAGRFARGGSTITQQVIKNTILKPEKTIKRKIKEMILAYKLEKEMTKAEILELYLNESPYGGTLYGAEEASLYYFGIHANDLNLAQSAYLAAMPQAPTKYSPYGNHKKSLDARQQTVLVQMLNQGLITVKEYSLAKKEEVEFVFKGKNSGIKAPHFVMYVLSELEKKYGRETLKTGGYKVHTSLNLDLQQRLEALALEKALEAEEKYEVTNAATVAIESKTGNIISMVGSRNYFDENIDGKFNVATALRQPGSSFKPIVYLSALEAGYTPETVLWDVQTEFSQRCPSDPDERAVEKSDKDSNCYRPKNFDSKFKGPIKIKNALPESRNIPAVKALYLVGVDKAISNAKKYGINTLNRPSSYYGLNLVLGGGEVKLMELVSTYATFSNEGVQIDPVAILRVENSEGEVIFEHVDESKRVVDKRYVLNLSEILADNSLKIPTFGVNSPLYFTNRQVASKTGTTNDNKDFWTIGYDPSVAIGVWVGNNNNISANSGRAGRIAHTFFRDAMAEALKEYEAEDFAQAPKLSRLSDKPVFRGVSNGNTVIRVDIATGGLATDETPEEYIKEIVLPEYHSILHWLSRKDPKGPVPERKDGSYENWEYGVNAWTGANKDTVRSDLQKALEELLQLVPSLENLDDTLFEEEEGEGDGSFKVYSPVHGEKFFSGEEVEIRLSKTREIDKYYFYINDMYLGATTNKSFKFIPKETEGVDDRNQLRVVAFGGGQVIEEKEITFKVRF